MIGMDRHTGRTLSAEAHLAQSIRDILTTRKGSRVMRRDYGSDVPALLDAPINGQTLTAFFAAVHEALARWEPRVRIDRVQLVESGDGYVEIEIEGVWEDTFDPGATVQGPDLQGVFA